MWPLTFCYSITRFKDQRESGVCSDWIWNSPGVLKGPTNTHTHQKKMVDHLWAEKVRSNEFGLLKQWIVTCDSLIALHNWEQQVYVFQSGKQLWLGCCLVYVQTTNSKSEKKKKKGRICGRVAKPSTPSQVLSVNILLRGISKNNERIIMHILPCA